ncbi:MAG: AMMECR1 domain-containing protein [Deltaproteobacteria bacterium]|nr:AMMECR1 domain-containing protein [Deltaproteobacteria bacterium]
MISLEEGTKLLVLCRKTLVYYLKTRKILECDCDITEKNKPVLLDVCLWDGKEIRGQATTHQKAPLWPTLQELVIQAATGDPKQLPLQSGELSRITLTIAIFIHFKKLSKPELTRIGTQQGLCITFKNNRGVLWPKEVEALRHDERKVFELLCQKAILPPHSYLNPQALLESFEVIQFSEKT